VASDSAPADRDAKERDFWHDVRVNVTKELIVKAITYTLGLPVVLGIVAAAVQPVRGWLLNDSHMPRFGVVLTVWLLLLAVAGVGRLAYLLNCERSRHGAIANLNGQQRPSTKLDEVPPGFEPDADQRAALAALVKSYPVTVSLEQVQDAIRQAAAGRTEITTVHAARALDWLIGAAVVEMVPSGNYNLTPPGRKVAPELAERKTGLLLTSLPMPTQELPASPKFTPETFELTPARRRALLALRHRVDARTNLHELHRLVTDAGMYIDQETTKAKVQRDMEDAERAGIVTIDRVGTLTQYYNLTAPDGRNWVLEHEHELKAGAEKGMARRPMR
jgi:hypothetical protein